MQPPPLSGLPFNAQMHQSDIERGYVVPNPYPRPLPPELESEAFTNMNLRSIKETYEEFMGVLKRSVVKVTVPNDQSTIDRIHRTIEYVIKEGPVFESIIIARENKNPSYSFFYDYQSPEHIYYRWKLYSILNGDDPYEWQNQEFRMFEGGSLWKPPPLNPYADGMPSELIEQATAKIDGKDLNKTPTFLEATLELGRVDDGRKNGFLGEKNRENLGNLLRNLDPTKQKIGSSMMFCINHADAATEIIDCIYESLQLLETPFPKKLARMYLISDILHNCSAAVTNASYYRKGFQMKLVSIFEHLREYLINLEDRYKADKFKLKVLDVLGAWKEWTLYEDEFIIKLSNILLGIKQEQGGEITMSTSISPIDTKPNREDDLDGLEVDEVTLSKCLEAKGLSLRWYKTLDLSDDDDDSQSDDDSQDQLECRSRQLAKRSGNGTSTNSEDRIKFKTSKWETVDPGQVAEQVVTISKWESMAKEEEEASSGSSTSLESSPSSPASKGTDQAAAKRLKTDAYSVSGSSPDIDQ